MSAQFVRVLFSGLLTLVIVGTAIFFTLRILPGDVARQILGESNATEEDIQALRHELGTDKPLYEQYVIWVGKLVRADPGNSLVEKSSIIGEFKRRFPLTVEIAVLSSIISSCIGLPVGIIAATRRNRIEGYLARVLGIIGLTIPVFLSGTLVLLFFLKFRGWTPPVGYQTFAESPVTHIQQIILPVLVLGITTSAILSRLVSGALADVLRQDYVRTARAKGLGPPAVLMRHVLRNALLPVITVFGYQFAFLLGGAVISERLFGLPGLGTWLVESIGRRDYPAIQFLVMFYVAVAIFVNLLVDFSYTILDPRTK